MNNKGMCERAEDLISFLYGELDEAGARNFDRHLHECGACEAEFRAFGQIHTSIVEWRNESLGGARSPALSEQPIPHQATAQANVHRSPSAFMALREFFVLSPLWMKGAAVIAAAMFCICAVLAVRYLQGRPSATVVVNPDRVYTQGDLDIQVERAVARTRDEIVTAHKQRDLVSKETPFPRRPVSNAPTSPGIGGNPRRPFTQQERQELAADLRLVTAKDEEDLDLSSDSNRPTP